MNLNKVIIIEFRLHEYVNTHCFDYNTLRRMNLSVLGSVTSKQAYRVGKVLTARFSMSETRVYMGWAILPVTGELASTD